MRHLFPLVLCLLVPLLARGANFTATIEETHPLNQDGSVEVANVNGAVTIATWDRAEVRLQAVKEARSEADLKALEVRVESGPDRFKVRTVYLDPDGNWFKKFTNTGEVRYTLTVPRTARLKKIETVNGPIEITGAAGRVTASSVNGRISAHQLRHEADLSTVNGAIAAEFDTITDKQDIKLETVNGGIDLSLPADTSAEMKASSVNGRIANDFGLPADNRGWLGRELDGRVGTGAARIVLHTVNGPIRILKRP